MNKLDFIDISMDNYYTDRYKKKITKSDLENFNDLNNNEMNKLINFIAHNKIKELKNILEVNKNNINYINIRDNDNETLLHFAVFSNNYKITKLLLKYGAKHNLYDNDGQTPLFRIIFNKNIKILELLMKYDVNINIKDNKGNTPLHIAVLSKNYIIIKALLKYGANPNTKNLDKLLPIDFAIKRINNEYNIDDKIVKIFDKFIQ
jgi:ankyrin repeat protein